MNGIQERLYSLDIFRGITVAAMILVNNPGSWDSVYPMLLHAEWHGCTPADLIFPFFLFISGVSIHLAFNKKKAEGLTRSTLLRLIKRAAIIFLLGLFLAWYTLPLSNMFTWERLLHLRIPGVLQRISIVWFCCSTLYFSFGWLGLIRIAALLLIAYYLMMTWIPVPGGIAPNLDPGTNLAAWSDRWLLDGHLWAQSKTWDPEGVLSTLPAIVSGILGMLTGILLTSIKEKENRTTPLFFTGAVLIVAGMAWSLLFPLNKSLWTSSFVLYTSGIAMQCLAVLYWIVDIHEIRTWTKSFLYYGVNAIFVFVASGIAAKTLLRIKLKGDSGNETSLWSFLYEHFYASWLSPKNASLFFALTFIVFFLVILKVMYHRNLIIKV